MRSKILKIADQLDTIYTQLSIDEHELASQIKEIRNEILKLKGENYDKYQNK